MEFILVMLGVIYIIYRCALTSYRIGRRNLIQELNDADLIKVESLSQGTMFESIKIKPGGNNRGVELED